jgi:hypothetical protein
VHLCFALIAAVGGGHLVMELPLETSLPSCCHQYGQRALLKINSTTGVGRGQTRALPGETLCPVVVYFVFCRICTNVYDQLPLPTRPETCLFCSPLVNIFLFAKKDQELKLTHPIFSFLYWVLMAAELLSRKRVSTGHLHNSFCCMSANNSVSYSRIVY